jgi:hypothetical protein
MKIKLPLLRKEFDEKTKTVKQIRGTLECDIDTTVYAEERWERHFPELAQREGLFEYAERITGHKEEGGRAYVAALLKAVFCFIESDDLPTYKSFAQLFDLADEKYSTELINGFKDAFDLILGSSATKN